MAKSDFVADFLTIIRNAARASKEKVTAPTSNMTTRIAEILKEEGFIDNVKTFNEGSKNFVRLHMKYVRDRKPAIQGIKRVSKPGRRVYIGHDEIPKVQGGLGVAIISTSQGIYTDTQARQKKAGGEILCNVW